MLRLFPLGLAAVLLTLSGCSSWSPYSDTTKLDLSLMGSEKLNPDINGRPSPIVVRLIELKHPVAFENADFFSLYQQPKDILSQDLVSTEELELRPGENRELKLTVQPGSRYVGVLAAYRDLPESSWRYVITLQPEDINHVALNLDALGIKAVDSSKAEAKP